jgi:hypothetical protein
VLELFRFMGFRDYVDRWTVWANGLLLLALISSLVLLFIWSDGWPSFFWFIIVNLVTWIFMLVHSLYLEGYEKKFSFMLSGSLMNIFSLLLVSVVRIASSSGELVESTWMFLFLLGVFYAIPAAIISTVGHILQKILQKFGYLKNPQN